MSLARRMFMEAITSIAGFMPLGADGWEFRRRRAERLEQQTHEQRERALARAEAKRARRRVKRLR